MSRSRKHIPGSGTPSAKAQQKVPAWPAEGTVRRPVWLKCHGKGRGCYKMRLVWQVESRSQGGLLARVERLASILSGTESHCWVFAGE